MSVLFLGMGASVQAAEMSFSVQAVIPENQVDKTQSYFDLRMTPDQGQDLVIEMRNDTDKEVTVNVTPNTAITNSNGVVEYNNTSVKRDNSLKVAFKDIAKAEEAEVTLPAKSQKQTKVHVQMPKEEFSGTVLGGIYFTEKSKDKDAKEENESEGSQIVNQYAYVIGVQLTENDQEVKPELRLNKVQAAQVNYRNVVTANIQNYTPTIIKDLKVEGNIYAKGSDKVLYSDSRENLRMAPNSNFDYAISLGNKPFKAGQYTFKGIAKSGDCVWNFEQDFEIKGEESRKYNKESVSLKRDYTWVYLCIGMAFFSLLCLIIIVLTRQLKAAKKISKEDTEEEMD